MEENKCQL